MNHKHRWHFVQNKMVFESREGGLFEQIDYAYFICNDCPDTNYEPNIVKRPVKVES